MNFDEAIRIHTNWKVTLRWMINGRQPLDEGTLGRDDACEIGQWLAGDGERLYGSYPAFAAARREHANFHRSCAEVVRLIRADDARSASAMLAPAGDFSKASAATVEAIRALKAEVEGGG